MNDLAKDVNKAKQQLNKANKKKNNQNNITQAQANYDAKKKNEDTVLRRHLGELLEFQEYRQRALLSSWTMVIDAMEDLVKSESKLVNGNNRWRTVSQRPMESADALVDSFLPPGAFPAPPNDTSAAGFTIEPVLDSARPDAYSANTLPPPAHASGMASAATFIPPPQFSSAGSTSPREPPSFAAVPPPIAAPSFGAPPPAMPAPSLHSPAPTSSAGDAPIAPPSIAPPPPPPMKRP